MKLHEVRVALCLEEIFELVHYGVMCVRCCNYLGPEAWHLMGKSRGSLYCHRCAYILSGGQVGKG